MNGQIGQHHSARPILPFLVTFIAVTRYVFMALHHWNAKVKVMHRESTAQYVLSIMQECIGQVQAKLFFFLSGTVIARPTGSSR